VELTPPEAVPKTSVGKFDKKVLRERFKKMPSHISEVT
jgi:acyl-CoA synthetase (AMP-forming)/AMP-acid ligase II